MPKPKTIFWLTLGVVTTALVALVVVVGPRQLLANGYHTLTSDTEYAPGFSESAFRKIKIGDTEASAKAAIGAPLAGHPSEAYILWIYSSKPQPDFASLGHSDPLTEFTIFDFELDGTLKGAIGQLIPTPPKGNLYTSAIGDGQNSLSLSDAAIKALVTVGTTTADIEAKHGKPTAIYHSPTVRWLVYSRSPSGSNYVLRWVGIDKSGKVSALRSQRYLD